MVLQAYSRIIMESGFSSEFLERLRRKQKNIKTHTYYCMTASLELGSNQGIF